MEPRCSPGKNQDSSGNFTLQHKYYSRSLASDRRSGRRFVSFEACFVILPVSRASAQSPQSFRAWPLSSQLHESRNINTREWLTSTSTCLGKVSENIGPLSKRNKPSTKTVKKTDGGGLVLVETEPSTPTVALKRSKFPLSSYTRTVLAAHPNPLVNGVPPRLIGELSKLRFVRYTGCVKPVPR